jgi:multidrug efflux pump
LIELTGENLDSLISASKKVKNYLDNKQIAGVEELKSDFQANKPEIIFDISRRAYECRRYKYRYD